MENMSINGKIARSAVGPQSSWGLGITDKHKLGTLIGDTGRGERTSKYRMRDESFVILDCGEAHRVRCY